MAFAVEEYVGGFIVFWDLGEEKEKAVLGRGNFIFIWLFKIHIRVWFLVLVVFAVYSLGSSALGAIAEHLREVRPAERGCWLS